mmetsp:Transcript_52246/g.117363  ORF Transcript_52246/g.117363 Transcript_52246/m.117363 type:complete len:205 (-) Transcript_52246:8-622(-)
MCAAHTAGKSHNTERRYGRRRVSKRRLPGASAVNPVSSCQSYRQALGMTPRTTISISSATSKTCPKSAGTRSSQHSRLVGILGSVSAVQMMCTSHKPVDDGAASGAERQRGTHASGVAPTHSVRRTTRACHRIAPSVWSLRRTSRRDYSAYHVVRQRQWPARGALATHSHGPFVRLLSTVNRTAVYLVSGIKCHGVIFLSAHDR